MAQMKERTRKIAKATKKLDITEVYCEKYSTVSLAGAYVSSLIVST